MVTYEEMIIPLMILLLSFPAYADIVEVGKAPGDELYEYVGDFWCSAYCSCKKCCGRNAKGITASGTVVQKGDCAVDPKVIPLGSIIYVEGVGFLKAVDTGSGVKGSIIDIYDENGHTHAMHYNDDLEGKHRVWILKGA